MAAAAAAMMPEMWAGTGATPEAVAPVCGVPEMRYEGDVSKRREGQERQTRAKWAQKSRSSGDGAPKTRR